VLHTLTCLWVCVYECVHIQVCACMLITERNAFFQESQPSMSPSSFDTIWHIVFKTCQLFVIYIKTCLCILPLWQNPSPHSIFGKVITDQKTNTKTSEYTFLTCLGHMQHFYVRKIPSWNSFILKPWKAFILILWNIDRTFRWLRWAVFLDIQGPWNALKNDIAEQIHRRLPLLLSVILFPSPAPTPPSLTSLKYKIS